MMSASTGIIAALTVALALLLAVLGFGYGPWSAHQQRIGEQRATTAYNAAIGQQKAAAGKLLQVETDRANAATNTLAAFKLEREKQDVETKIAIDRLAARLRAAAGPAGQLRDPNAVAGCGGGGAGAPGADPARAGGGAGDGAEADGLLSAELSGLLFEQAKIADQINVAYTSCRADALAVREVLK